MKENKAQKLLELGSNIAGTVIATGAAAFLVAGPAESAAIAGGGVLLSEGLKQLCNDLYDRVLSKREKQRVGAAAAFAIELIKERLVKGQKLRTDDFFDPTVSGRSKGDEIFEGVLLKARDTYQEKKIKFISSIFANVAFNLISDSYANQLLRLMGVLSYRQLCCLALFQNNTDNAYKLRDQDYNGSPTYPELVSELQDIYELYNYGLTFCREPHGNEKLHLKALLSHLHIDPASMILTPLGNNLYYLADLGEISKADIEGVASILIH